MTVNIFFHLPAIINTGLAVVLLRQYLNDPCRFAGPALWSIGIFVNLPEILLNGQDNNLKKSDQLTNNEPNVNEFYVGGGGGASPSH
jgi:hypothetical protein